MTMQISVDPAGLTQAQREAVAGFILAYPSKACAGSCKNNELTLDVKIDTTAAHAAIGEIHQHAVAAGLTPAQTLAVGGAIDPELVVLQHDHESTMPEAAFGKPDEVAAAFGVPPAPLPLGATVAPFTAAAAPLSTAPVAMPATTLPATSTVPAPPAPMPANAAPVAAPPMPSPASGVELDKNGLPWDMRIHAQNRAKVADGSWRKGRGVDPALVATVEAELRALMGTPSPAQQVATAAMPTATSGPVSSAAVVPAPPQAPAAPVAPSPVAPSADLRQQFVALIGRASAASNGPNAKVTTAELNQCCSDAGVPALPLLANRLDLLPQVAANIDALIASRQ